MTRHAKNCTAGACYTYHEKKKDESQSGYGSKNVRLGKDSLKEFDCCCLSLQPCRDPVITQDGFLYDKQAILEYILHEKRNIARKLKEFEKQKRKLETEMAELAKAENESKAAAFKKLDSGIIHKTGEHTASKTVSNMKNGQDKALPSFWIPALTPAATPTLVKKPDEKVRCPMSGKSLKLKDLIPVNFTPIKDRDDKTALIAKQARYVCAVTNDVLGNSVPCAVLKTSGNVVTMECVEKIIRRDMVDPISGQKLTDKDIIQMNKGASGFSAAGNQLEAAMPGPSMQA